MTVQELRQAIVQNQASGCFLFYGEEDYLKQHYAGELKKHILAEAALAELNHTLFDGQDITMPALLDAVKAVPMMADFRLVEWRHADIEEMKAKDFERLLEICEETKNEYPYTLLLIVATEEGLDAGNGKQVGERLKKMSAVAETVCFEKSTDGQLTSWIHRHFAHEKLSDSPEICRLLLLRSGHDMGELLKEMDKVICYVKSQKRDTVTEKDILFVTCPKAENDTYALSNALLEGDLPSAFSCFEEMKSRRVDPSSLAGQLFRVYTDLATVSVLVQEGKSTEDIAKILRMNAYKTGLYVKATKRMSPEAVAAALAACKETDRYYKSVYVNTYDQLEKLLVRIIGRQR